MEMKDLPDSEREGNPYAPPMSGAPIPPPKIKRPFSTTLAMLGSGAVTLCLMLTCGSMAYLASAVAVEVLSLLPVEVLFLNPVCFALLLFGRRKPWAYYGVSALLIIMALALVWELVQPAGAVGADFVIEEVDADDPLAQEAGGGEDELEAGEEEALWMSLDTWAGCLLDLWLVWSFTMGRQSREYYAVAARAANG